MMRLLSIGIECFSSMIFLIPAISILQYAIFKQHNFNKLIAVFIFAFYLMAVFSVTGTPTFYTLRLNLGFNFVPLVDIVNSPIAYIINTVLNIFLFMPMGFLLPSIWKEYRSVKKIAFIGFAMSATIEILQIFTFRLTDIDDLITNTIGSILGYRIGKNLSFKLPLKISANDKDISIKYEPAIIFAIIFLISFFLQPFVSNAIWDIVLSSQLWESIK